MLTIFLIPFAEVFLDVANKAQCFYLVFIVKLLYSSFGFDHLHFYFMDPLFSECFNFSMEYLLLSLRLLPIRLDYNLLSAAKII